MKRVLIVIAILSHICVKAQVADSINTFSNSKKLFDTKVYQMTYISVPLIAAGLVMKSEDDYFRSLRNDYLPEYHVDIDDYMQYSPMALMLGLKVAGVEGRSSWGRMLTSDAFSAALMSSSVYMLKSMTNVMRPDGSSSNSFPSGHTATAFMAATMLYKEYGEVSPWYSIGGYTMATATGMMRMVNNRHWLSDVLVGASIGILSTEVGYFLADLIFKDRGLNQEAVYRDSPSWFDNESPSTFGLYLGLSRTMGEFALNDGSILTIGKGSRVGFEGSCFFNKYFGVGARISLMNLPLLVDNNVQNSALDLFSGSGGLYFAAPISPAFRITSKLLGSYNYYHSHNYSIDDLSLMMGGKLGVGTGAAIEYLSNERWAIKLFADYDATYIKGIVKDRIHKIMVVGVTGSAVF